MNVYLFKSLKSYDAINVNQSFESCSEDFKWTMLKYERHWLVITHWNWLNNAKVWKWSDKCDFSAIQWNTFFMFHVASISTISSRFWNVDKKQNVIFYTCNLEKKSLVFLEKSCWHHSNNFTNNQNYFIAFRYIFGYLNIK